MSDAIDVSDKTKFAMPVRNLISLVASVAVGVWAYFGIIDRLNRIETEMILVNSDLVKNTEFRIKWPRGELSAHFLMTLNSSCLSNIFRVSSKNFCTT